jgi:hypothetical protein
VHRCRSDRGIQSLRPHTISKICALWLVTLILLPFTAPFKTYELGNAASDRSHDWLPKDKTDSDEKLTAPSSWLLFWPALNSRIVKHFARLGQIEEHQLHCTILRL